MSQNKGSIPDYLGGSDAIPKVLESERVDPGVIIRIRRRLDEATKLPLKVRKRLQAKEGKEGNNGQRGQDTTLP